MKVATHDANTRSRTTNDLCMPSFRTGFENLLSSSWTLRPRTKMFLLYHMDQKSFIFASPIPSLCLAFDFSVVVGVSVITHCLHVISLPYLCIFTYFFIYQPFSLHTQPHIYGFAFDVVLFSETLFALRCSCICPYAPSLFAIVLVRFYFLSILGLRGLTYL